MRSVTILAFLPVLLAVATPATGSEPGGTSPIVHEEVGRVWDELSRQLHSLSDRWCEHFIHREGRAERPLITLMLRHREELGLSPEQVRDLERVRSDFQREAIRREADLRVAEADLSRLLDAESVDLMEVEPKIREIERLRAELRLARIRTLEQGKAQLSPEQRKKLQNLLAEPRYSRLRSGPLH
ncbi:MAG: periplasmic heavy metal sensor [Deltaproteobacteria bacterium]|nr:periplasmic heavy metal sensor [Deltaproteobacteria bacterium]